MSDTDPATSPTTGGDVDTHLSPEVADTIAEQRSPGGGPDIEYARVKNLVRGELFGRDAVPTRIGRFTVLRRLGAGGMSVVYSAYDDELDRKVAIKLLRPNPDAPAAGTRLRREAQAIARLSHPNVIPVYEVGEHRGELFIAMEFVRGQTLRAWMDERPRPWHELRDLVLQAGEGLHAAHQAGVVHRDFKPENVMLGDDGRVRVLDFGVAAFAKGIETEPPGGTAETAPETHPDVFTSNANRLTRDGTILGTPAYMSPEALAGQRVDARADQFSFCLTCWEALTGERPFGATTLHARQEAIAAGPQGALDAPSGVRDALRQGLRPDPDRRWPDMRSLLGALAPRPRSWALWGFVAVLLAVAGGTGAVAVALRSPADACSSAPDDLAEVWGTRKSRDATGALARGKGAVALGLWTAAQARLDTYAEAWLEARQESCARDPREGERALQREMCFAWTLQDLQALVTPLTDGDTAAVSQVSASVDALTRPASCRDPAEVSRAMEERARRAAPAPDGSSDGVLSDFETARWARFGAGWATSTDQVVGGASRSQMSLTDAGAGGSQHALQIRGTVAVPDEGQPAWSGAMIFLGETPFAPANLMSKRRLTLWARGTPGPAAVMLFTARAGFQPALAQFDLTEDWHRHVFELDTLERERFDATAAFVGAVVPGPFSMEIDDVSFE